MYQNFLVLFLCTIFLSAPKDEAIPWRENVKLSWSDFKGHPKINVPAVALTAAGITFEFSAKESRNELIDIDTKVEAHFYPQKSWYKKEHSNLHILAHEQLHFDITELYARKFRKRITELKASNKLKLELQNLYQTINKELNVKQNLYDKETKNSTDVIMQEQWSDDIHLELAKLNAYKSKD